MTAAVALLTADAKTKLSSTIRGLRDRLLTDLHNAADSAYKLSIRDRTQAGLTEAQRRKRQRLEEWLDEQLRAELGKQTPVKGKPVKPPTKAAERQIWERHLRDAEKLAAATLLNRLVVIKQLEAMGEIKPKVVTGGWESPGYRDFRDFAPELCRADAGDGTEGYSFLLQLLFDELALELPGLFGPVGQMTGLTELFPVPEATLRHVVEQLNQPELESAWGDDTTLGWVYQYWNDPEREALDAKLNGGGKVEPHEVASKTQMFTERYMVEWLLQNSLGQQWLAICAGNGWVPWVESEGVLARLAARRAEWRAKREAGEVALDALMPIETALEGRWKYWVEQPGVRGSQSLTSIRDIKILDPACGSGHFLVIAFDLLVALYEEEARHRGVDWSGAEIGEWILANNLHGLDLDPRAVQIAAAGLFLKARGLGARVSRLNLVASSLSLATLPGDDPARVALQVEVEAATGIPAQLTEQIVAALAGADAWGSLLRVDEAVDRAIREFEAGVQLELGAGAPLSRQEQAAGRGVGGEGLRALLVERLEAFLARCTRSDDLGLRLRGEQLAAGVRFIRLVREGAYDLVVGNPPYQGSSKMAEDGYLKRHYPRGKADLYAAFLERGLQLAKPGGLSALLTMRNWMFISQYSAIREYLIDNFDLRSLGDFDRGAFDEVPNEVLAVVMSVFRNQPPSGELSVALQPTPFDDLSYDRQRTNRKRAAVLAQLGRFEFRSDRFEAIKEKPLIYWWDEEFLKRYAETSKVGEEAPVKFGANTGNNSRFIRSPWEVQSNSIYAVKTFATNALSSTFRWVPYIKGAAGKVWFENLSHIIKWQQQALELKVSVVHNYGEAGLNWKICNSQYYFEPGIAFVMIGAGFSARAHRYKSVIDSMGTSVFSNDLSEVTCLLNSYLSKTIATALNPSIHFQVGDVNRLPLFPIESADEIFIQLDRAFTQHEAARETSIEFKQPGPTCWPYAQTWAQQAVDRPAGTPLPEWQPEYENPEPTAHISYALGIALGRFGPNGEGILSPASNPQTPNRPSNATIPLSKGDLGGRLAASDTEPTEALPHGILYLSAYSGDRPDSPDNLNHPACAPLRTAWEQHRRDIDRKKNLHTWLREKFFSDCHLKQYEQRPIYLPLSSDKKNFVAHLSIHRWTNTSLQTLIADHLRPDLTLLEGELADLGSALSPSNLQGSTQDQAKAEKRRNDLLALRQELEAFIRLVQQCAEQGPPPASPKDPPRETNARFIMDLDDGVMINSAALWPLLEPQGWKKPKTWWSELCTANGKKDYDWSHLAARYFPSRVDGKCRTDPSLAVAHGCFWRYHPAKAYEWELRLQDEIGPHFTLDEPDSTPCRQDFETNHPDQAAELKEKETKRRERKHKKEDKDPHSTSNEAQLALNL